MLILTRASRGEVIITQKEAKGEYGSNTWLWNRDTANGMPAEYGNQELQPHVFDNTNKNNTPIPARMSGKSGPGTGYSNTDYSDSYYCINDYATSSGDILMSGNQMLDQISCKPNTNNIGNYYDWIATVAENGTTINTMMPNSICPRGWQLPNGSTSDVNKSYASISFSYAEIGSNASGLDSSVVQSLLSGAVSFIYSGRYNYGDSSLTRRGSNGSFWSGQARNSTEGYDFAFYSTGITPRDNSSKGNGYTVRCVAR